MTAITGTTGTGASGAATSGAQATSIGQLDPEAFLKLLVAQLRYQDPGNPVDSSQFMGQTAQFTMVEKLNAIEADQRDLLTAQLLLGASSLVGRTVAYRDPAAGADGAQTDDAQAGEVTTGVVTSATIAGSDPTLRVGDTDVPLSWVTEVRSTAG